MSICSRARMLQPLDVIVGMVSNSFRICCLFLFFIYSNYCILFLILLYSIYAILAHSVDRQEFLQISSPIEVALAQR
jgi:hypothetical protein